MEAVIEQNNNKNALTPDFNHLKDELSPYLLQHADNPINWHVWGAEAFNAAKQADKPIFLSIGYSSCHWCHVMERECFNDLEVAELMNDACIAIKVDREERPDLDDLFMEICKLQNGSGGWPLNVFLTPDGRPFFATTWLPKRTKGQMPGLTDILPRVKWLWLMQKGDIMRAANELANTIKERQKLQVASSRGGRIGAAAVREALIKLRENFDAQWGGFGEAPKFPSATRLLFLIRQSESVFNSKPDQDNAFSMVDLTLRRMWRGGIHDHLGGGFSRYATDEKWLVPHFEKLLADQAMLLYVAARAQEHKADNFYAMLAEDIAGCVTRDFLDNNSQCFKTAIDGDTDEGEGAYYLWQDDEIHNLLPEGDAGLFCAAYAVMPGGNFGSEVAGSQIGYNILYEATTVSALAQRYSMDGAEIAKRLINDRKILLEARNKRAKPLYDDKILMDWNGFIIGALAKASDVFNKPEWRNMAEKAAMNLQKALTDPKGNWRRRIRNNSADIPALAGDYAALLWGIMELYNASKKAGSGEKQLKDWLKYAANLADLLIENFRDENSGGLFLALKDSDDPFLFFRRISPEDNSLPSVNALAALALNELGAELEEKKYADIARKIIACFARAVNSEPLENLTLITAAALWRPVKPKPVEKAEKPEKADKAEKSEKAGKDLDSEIGENAENQEGEEVVNDRASRRAQRAARQERASRHERGERASAREARSERAERRARPQRASRRER